MTRCRFRKPLLGALIIATTLTLGLVRRGFVEPGSGLLESWGRGKGRGFDRRPRVQCPIPAHTPQNRPVEGSGHSIKAKTPEFAAMVSRPYFKGAATADPRRAGPGSQPF